MPSVSNACLAPATGRVAAGGWETAAMVRRYAHLAVSHLAPYASRAGLLIANDGRTETRPSPRPRVWAQIGHSAWYLKTGPTVSPRIEGKFMVARGGIEPPTRGFSVR